MALEFKIDSLEKVETQFHSLYEKAADGSFQLSVSGIDTGEELKGALKKEREEKERIAKLLKEKEDKLSADEKKTLEEKEEYKKLWEKERQEKLDLKNKVINNDKKSLAYKIVSSLTKDQKRANLLTEQVLKGITATDDGTIAIKGIPGIENQEDMINHLKKEYDFLVDGSNANGGGAGGSDNKGGTDNKKTKTSEEFLKLNGHEKNAFLRSGGIVVAG